MFDIGWQELIVIGVLAVIVMGPKELPRALRTVTALIRKARSMAGEFQRGIDELVREAELDDLRKQVEQASRTDVSGEIERTIDPKGDLRKSLDARDVEAELDGRSRPAGAAARRIPSPADPAYDTDADEDPPPDKAEVVEPEPAPETERPDKSSATG